MRLEACPASLDLRSCLRASCSALRDSGWNIFSFLALFCGFFVGAMSLQIGVFLPQIARDQWLVVGSGSGQTGQNLSWTGPGWPVKGHRLGDVWNGLRQFCFALSSCSSPAS